MDSLFFVVVATVDTAVNASPEGLAGNASA
jgi:hypothetical protein